MLTKLQKSDIIKISLISLEEKMVSYKKLWKLLIDKDMKKSDLAKCADLSTYTIQKLNRNENVTVETLAKICLALNCTVDDIMEVIIQENGEA